MMREKTKNLKVIGRGVSRWCWVKKMKKVSESWVFSEAKGCGFYR